MSGSLPQVMAIVSQALLGGQTQDFVYYNLELSLLGQRTEAMAQK